MFGLINMNARLYDPALGRFLSPDPVIQDPEDSQNYNRYTYCLNNPLAFVDLTGETFYYTRNNESINKFLYAKYGGDAYLYLSYYYDGPWYYHPYSKGLDPYVLYYDDAVNKFFYSTQGGVKDVMPGYLDMYPKEAYSGYSGGGLPHGGGKGSSAGSGSGSSTMSTVHDVLDIVGLIPGFDAADLINAGIYLIEGDKINAALSMAAVIPVIGGAATAGKVAGTVEKSIGKGIGF
jgi:RHS repeat-associated protein